LPELSTFAAYTSANSTEPSGSGCDRGSIPVELPFARSESTIQQDAKTTLVHAPVQRQRA
jgi:hypothetical protein